MDIKHTLNEVYNKITRPLNNCTEDLNSVSGMLKYMQTLERVKLLFELEMKNAEAELIKKYPAQKEEIKKHLSFLKHNLSVGKSLKGFLFYCFIYHSDICLLAA